MTARRDSRDSTPDPRPLEERLRNLPPPAVPPYLRERILSAAPRFQPAPKRVRRALWWSVAGSSAAAAAVLAAFLLPLDRAGRLPATREPATAPPDYHVLYAATTDPKETDPCYVLPPLPEWRS